MNTVTPRKFLLACFGGAAAFGDRLRRHKAAEPAIAWYPFNTLDKLLSLQLVLPERACGIDEPVDASVAVLDVGAADGDLAFLMESMGAQVTAVDNHHSNNNRMQGIRRMRELLQSPMQIVDTDIDFGLTLDRTYDLVILLDVFYHLRNPLGVLLNLCRFGKHLVFSTRVFDALPRHEGLGQFSLGYLLAPMEAAPNDPTNYWVFSTAGLRRALDRSGWSIVEELPFGYPGGDSDPFTPARDRRVLMLCERVTGWQGLFSRHVAG